jgi:uncharacterized protein YndB with AHSA1/START domain
MHRTRITRRVNAPRERVYRAFLDAGDVARWMVPTGMTSTIHAFEGRQGGAFRITLSYDQPTGTGKTTAHSDTFHGRFVELVPPARIVQAVEFESDDPAMRGEMTITISLAEVDGGTEIVAVHDRLPPGLSPADNETGWQSSLGKLADLVEADEVGRLRADNQRLRGEVVRLRGELERLGRYLAAPPGSDARADPEAEIGWAYQRGDLDDDLGDD